MIFYFDVSSLNRPFDDQKHPRIRLEAESVLLLMEYVERGDHQHVSSEMAVLEIKAAAEADLRRRLFALLPKSADILSLNESLFRRADELQLLGFKAADAVHVAAAERWNADVLFTCDDRLCRIAKRNAKVLTVLVTNPLAWVQEHLR